MKRRAAVIALLLLGCAAAQRPRAPRGPATARDFLPLRTGAAWSYDVQTGIGGDTVLSTLAVVRVDGDRFLVRGGARTETYELRPDGVVREGEYIVKDPVRVGASWEGRSGATFTVRALEANRRVGEVDYREVVAVERLAPGTRIATTTWFARDLGVVEIRASTQSSLGTTVSVRSTLRGYTLGEPPAEGEN